MHKQSAVAVADRGSGLRYQRCTWCDSAQVRPALVCRVCRSESFRWERSAGVGQIVSSPALIRKPLAPPRFVTVRLDEGPLVDGLVRGGPQDRLWPGARVRLSADEEAAGRPVFELTWAD